MVVGRGAGGGGGGRCGGFAAMYFVVESSVVIRGLTISSKMCSGYCVKLSR